MMVMVKRRRVRRGEDRAVEQEGGDGGGDGGGVGEI